MITAIVSVAFCGVCFLYTSYMLCSLTYFLSNHNENIQQTVRTSVIDENVALPMLRPLIVDMSLLSVFMLQHSVMATDYSKNLFCKLGIQYMERSTYNMASAAALHLLLRQWQRIPWLSLWNIDTSFSSTVWLIFTGVHVLAWLIIYSGCLMLDISELAGLKQVYYKFSYRPSPMDVKSRDLLRYYSHMRHPSFTGFLLILWIHPSMTLDRVLLASILTIYMALMWNIDQHDYNYHASLVRRKQRKLL